MPLKVAGAFHTRFMAPAVETLRAAASDVAVSDPALPLWTNFDGSVLTSGSQAVDRLVAQVASPVRWDLCMASFADRGITGLIEFSPAGTLVGLAKRALKGVPAVAVKTPDDLAAAAALLEGGAE
jgi:[acyl-carrier-protein] S-malonyltransferase